MSTADKPHCDQCRFWQPPDPDCGDEWMRGECRRRAPILIELHFQKFYEPRWDDDSTPRTNAETRIWPLTHGDDWCGEWEIKQGCPGAG